MDGRGKLGNDDAGYVRAGFVGTSRDEHEEVEDIDSERVDVMSELKGCAEDCAELGYRPADPEDDLTLLGYDLVIARVSEKLTPPLLYVIDVLDSLGVPVR